MSFFGKLFGSKSSSDSRGGANLEKQLAELEAEAKEAPLGFQGRPLNRAGDVCLQAGDRDRALRYYGMAIDAFLDDSQPEAARGVANKIIRVHPDAVRTLCTLTWLDLASRHMASAVEDLRLYTEAAKKAGREDMTIPQVLQMASLVKDGTFLEAAEAALEQLGAEDDSERVADWRESGGSDEALEDGDEMLDACFKAAVGSNKGRDAEDAVA